MPLYTTEVFKGLFLSLLVVTISIYALEKTNLLALTGINRMHPKLKEKENEMKRLRKLRLELPPHFRKPYKTANTMRGMYTTGQYQNPLTEDFAESLPFQGPYNFLPNYKNPCFRDIKGLQCLPYFYLIGVSKSATSDLFERICRHPNVARSHSKETQFWPRKRFEGTPYTKFLLNFKSATQMIEERVNRLETVLYHSAITGTGTPSDFWDNDYWYKDMYNKDLNEPRVLTAHHLYHINPKSKIIIIFRNPADRLYSDYCYRPSTRKTASAQGFHENVTNAVRIYTECFKKYSQRKCVYDHQLAEKVNVWIRVGLYDIYMQDWLDVFPREQFLLLSYEEYRTHRRRSLSKVFEFLQLDTGSLTHLHWSYIVKSKNKNTNFRKKHKSGWMLNSTRTILNIFYNSSNMAMSNLFDKDGYLWT